VNHRVRLRRVNRSLDGLKVADVEFIAGGNGQMAR
jgi:hypothetical protein